MKVLVSDTSVLIDLDRGSLVEPTFRLPFEFTALLARVVGELLDEVLVGAAEKIGLGHAVVAQRNLGEVLDQAREHGVAVPGVAELAFVVVVDAGEYAFERAVLLLQRRARLVQRLPDVRGPLLDGVPPRPVRHEELVLVRVGPRDILGHAIRLLLEEQHLVHTGGPGSGQGIDELCPDAPIVDRESAEVEIRP